tara:strand:- start:19 stop:216 length:198 start_codon:yes stop_codon:yes gene_type:complete
MRKRDVMLLVGLAVALYVISQKPPAPGALRAAADAEGLEKAQTKTMTMKPMTDYGPGQGTNTDYD